MSVRMPGGRARLPVPARGVGTRVRRRGVRGGARLVRRRASRRAGGALHPDRQRTLDAPRGEARVHRAATVRGVGCRAVVRRVVPGHATRLSPCSTVRIHQATDQSSASARHLTTWSRWSTSEGKRRTDGRCQSRCARYLEDPRRRRDNKSRPPRSGPALTIAEACTDAPPFTAARPPVRGSHWVLPLEGVACSAPWRAVARFRALLRAPRGAVRRRTDARATR